MNFSIPGRGYVVGLYDGSDHEWVFSIMNLYYYEIVNFTCSLWHNYIHSCITRKKRIMELLEFISWSLKEMAEIFMQLIITMRYTYVEDQEDAKPMEKKERIPTEDTSC
uniref:Ovule protein n=1 Tax=Heterorhabditis bacteriophora TaxID=37862 RepID=A0A1I7WVJ0_HETBA